MSELLPCPFCGGDAAMEVIPGIRSPITRWAAVCHNTDCGPVSESIEEAIARWNTRTPVSDPTGKER